MALQALVLPLVSVFRSAGFNEAMKALKGLDGSFKDVAKSAGFAAANFAAAGALQGFTAYVDQAVTVTQKFERNLLALNQVFDANSGQMKQFAEDAVNMGISQGQAAQASVFLGSVLKQYGVSAGQTVAQTQKLVALSQDLATTYGYDLSEALVAITALFRGEYDPIEKFGVAMKQSEINALLAARGQKDLTGELLLQAQVQARLDLLYQRSADAMGAFDRASGTLYVSQQKLNAAIENQQIAFGQPLQKPIAEATDLLANLVLATTPLLEDLGKALGATITLVTDLAEIVGTLLVPSFDIFTESVSLVVQFFDTWGATLETTNQKLQQLGINLDNAAIADFFDKVYLPTALVNSLEFLNEQLQNTEYASRAASGNFASFDNGAKRASVAMRGSAYAAREAREAQEATAESGKKLEASLKAIGTAADEASGSTSGLSQVFKQIENAAAQSKAKTALEELGLSAGLIEQVLTQPNWAEIFSKITRYAQLAAIEIAKIPSVTAAAAYYLEKSEIEKYLANAFKVDSGKVKNTAEKAAKDYVAAFRNGLRESQNQASAASQLAARGASEGLIDSILSSENWMKVWLAIKNGTLSLKELQAQFYQTAEGAAELRKQAEEIAAATESVSSVLSRLVPADELGEFQNETLGIFKDFREELKSLVEAELIGKQNYENLLGWTTAFQNKLMDIARQRDEVVKQIAETEEKLKDVRAFELSDRDIANFLKPFEAVDDTISEYEQNVTNFIDSIMEKIADGLEQEIFTPAAAANLQRVVTATKSALNAIAQEQERVAGQLKRFQEAFDFREATKQAVVAFADVTDILSKASDKLNKATKSSASSTTEIIAQTIKAARNGRDYRVVLIKELDEVQQATASASDITAGLEDVLASTRDFANNLKLLQSAGLNTEVFRQIVEAGTEVGNQTAKAILEGGPEAIEAINALYKDIELASADASTIAADKVYDLNGEVIDAGIKGLKDKQFELATQASDAAKVLTGAFQAQVAAYEVDLSGLLQALKDKEQALKDVATTLGKAFADTLTGYVNTALAGAKVPVVTPNAVEDVIAQSTGKTSGAPVTEFDINEALGQNREAFVGIGQVASSSINGLTEILVNSAEDVTALVDYLDLRIGAASNYMQGLYPGSAEWVSALGMRSEFSATQSMLRERGYAGQPYVINVNVKTDSTQSNAMVGKTIGNVLNKYITAGGGIVVSPGA